MFHKRTHTFLLALGLLCPLAVPSAHAFDRHDDVTDAQRELKKDTRKANKELREDLRHADDRRDVREAYREYNQDVRDARREYQQDVGRAVTTLPRGYQRYNWGGRDYYYNNGAYYQRGSNGYVIVRPPNGAVVAGLPRGARIVNMHGERLYYANGLYYRPVGPSRFVVIAP